MRHTVFALIFIVLASTPRGTAVWQPVSTWGTVTAIGLNPGTACAFRVAAQNEEEVWAGWSDWGYTNIGSGDSFTIDWVQGIPALGSVIGVNTFTLRAADVTWAPYNQPPYAPSGDTDTDSCLITAMAP